LIDTRFFVVVFLFLFLLLLLLSPMSVLLLKRGFHSSLCNLKRSSVSHLTTKDNKKFQLVAYPEAPELTTVESAFANKMFARPARFIQSISKAEQAPELSNPEVRRHESLSCSQLINFT
jgi:hypothetical protein